jgi:prominin 1
VTQAVAIDNLADIVSGLGNVKRHLRDIQNQTLFVQDKVGQLRLGLSESKEKLLGALSQCSSNNACVKFMQEYNIGRDLAVASDFENLPLQLTDVSPLLKDIADLMNNDIEKNVRGGQKQLDKVKLDIEASMGDLRPKIKAEIRQMGQKLEEKAGQIQELLNEVEAGLSSVHRDIPEVQPILDEYGLYAYYIGLGMSCLVLLILSCHILGLFYGFCGKRPGNVYGDDCCNRGSGANWLLAGVYLTFLFSLVLLALTTVLFVLGSTAEKVACQALNNPNDSEIFRVVDTKFIQPFIEQQYPQQKDSPTKVSMRHIISSVSS